LEVASRIQSNKKTVLSDEEEDAKVIPAEWREKTGGKLRFAVIGTEMTVWGIWVPGTLCLRLTLKQKTIEEGPWNTVADRPIYCVSPG